MSDPTKNYMYILPNVLIGLLFVLASISTVGSTTPDILFYNGEKLLLQTEPLCSLYLKHSGMIEFQESCCVDDKARGYVATWEIVNDTLYLTDVVDTNETTDWATIPRLDPAAWDGRQTTVPATWVSGTLHAYREGEAMEYISMRNASAYIEDLLFKIEKGELVNMDIIQNKVEEREKLTRINPFSRIWVLVSSLTMVALVLMSSE